MTDSRRNVYRCVPSPPGGATVRSASLLDMDDSGDDPFAFTDEKHEVMGSYASSRRSPASAKSDAPSPQRNNISSRKKHSKRLYQAELFETTNGTYKLRIRVKNRLKKEWKDEKSHNRRDDHGSNSNNNNNHNLTTISRLRDSNKSMNNNNNNNNNNSKTFRPPKKFRLKIGDSSVRFQMAKSGDSPEETIYTAG